MKLFIDINTGRLSKVLGGPAWFTPRFREGDITDIKLSFVDGKSLVTSTVLGASQTLTIAIKSRLAATSPLVVNSGYALAGQVATTKLDFTTLELSNYLSDFVAASMPGGPCWLEVQVEASDSSTIETLFLGRVLVMRSASAGVGGSNITLQDGSDLVTQDGNTIVTQ